MLKTYALQNWTFSSMIEKIQSEKIKLDAELFQRNNIADDQWSSYLVKSFVEGKSINTITIAKLNKQDRRFRTSDYNIYDELNLDGLQRLSALMKFKENQIKLPSGTVLRYRGDAFKYNIHTLPIGAVITRTETGKLDVTVTINRDMTKSEILEEFGDIGTKVLDYSFYENTLEIRYHLNMNLDQCNDEFLRLNNSNPLTNQEIRNAHNNELAITIRRLVRGKTVIDEHGTERYIERPHELFNGQTTANKYKPSLLGFSNMRFDVEEEVARALLLFKHDVKGKIKLNKTNLDKLYREGEYRHIFEDIDKLKTYLSILHDLVSQYNSHAVIPVQLTKKQIQALPAILYMFLHDTNKEIVNSDRVLEILLRAYQEKTFIDEDSTVRNNAIEYKGDHGLWVRTCYEYFKELIDSENENESLVKTIETEIINS